MNGKIKQNITLIIGLAVPILMILFVAGAIYIPRVFTTVDPPKYDFLYMAGRGYGDVRYSVRNGKLVKEKIKRSNQPLQSYHVVSEVKFFVHNVRDNKSEEITFEDAGKLKMDSSVRAPDGYTIVHGRRSTAFFPFFASWDYQTRYLKKDSMTQKLNLEIGENTSYPYYSFQFLGWIVK